MFYIIEFIRRRFFLAIAVVLIGGYTLSAQFGMGDVFTTQISGMINEHLPQIKPYLEEVRNFLNNLKL